ncbi:MAG: plasmid mobilization protein [Thermoanaerobaculia bacterium]
MSTDPDKPTPPHRTVIRSARFTPEEWGAVRERAATAGLSPSRFLRSVALGSPLGRRMNAEAVLALNRVGVNLNNLIRLAIRTDQPFVVADVTDLLNQLRDRLRELL